MRKIEEIKADIEADKEMRGQGIYKNHSDFAAKVEAEISELRYELRAAYTDGIPLSKLESLCTAYKEGRCVILPERLKMPHGCKMHYEAEYLGIGKCNITEEGCEGYATSGEEPHDNCKDCKLMIGYESDEAALKQEGEEK